MKIMSVQGDILRGHLRRWMVLLVSASLMPGVWAENPKIRIMPMGDSITWGYDLSDPSKYPGVTQKPGGYRIKLYEKLVAAGYNVEFCGSQNGNNPSDAPAAAQRHEGYSGYTISRSFYAALDPDNRFGGVLERIPVSFRSAQNPHVILLHLGTNVGSMGNDATISAGLGMNGEQTLSRYGLRDMSRLLDALSEKQPGAEIIVTTLLDRDHHRDGKDTAQPGVVAFNAGLPALVAKHAEKGQKVHFFDLNPFVPLADMPDGAHPNGTGYAKMADGWFTAITNLIPDPAAFTPDDAPGIVASELTGASATIWYNQPMGESAGATANYRLGKPSISVTAAASDGTDPRRVNLTLSSILPNSETVEVFAKNVTNSSASAASVRCSTALVDLSAEDMVCAAGAGRIAADERTVFAFLRNGTITIPRAGTVEVLLVGGGGGGGTRTTGDQSQAAGGGGGGVVYKKAIRVTAGTYAVTVGAGGEVGANGGNSSVFGLTAYGGGSGAAGISLNSSPSTRQGSDGASGGGSATAYTTLVEGGAARYAAEDNFGSAGGPTIHVYGCGGGGGAGAPGSNISYLNGAPKDSVPRDGGDGIEIPMFGPGEFFGGGGAGYRVGNDWAAQGGKGGGGGYDQDGEDGRGGGGCGGRKGGSGLVVVSFAASTLEDEPSDSDDFDVTGGDETVSFLDSTARIFRQDGTLRVTGSGFLELLMVGGGGGGGEWGSNRGCGGGGAGGLLHLKSMPVTAGEYAVTIGAGGDVGANGGDTTVFSFTAFGGGAGGAKGGNPGKAGASGGGGAVYDGEAPLMAGGAAIFRPFGNLGHAGGNSVGNQYGSAGGGGAGAPGKPNDPDGVLLYSKPGGGGDGYLCTILGTNGWYAGGGAGTRSDFYQSVVGGKGGGGSGLKSGTSGQRPFGTAGVDGLGGGGAGDMPGGSGTVIVRYRKSEYATEFRDAEGGVVSTRQGFRIHTFTESGTFTMPCVGLVEVLLVGGGGGGGACSGSDANRGGAGGGAGGFIHTNMVLMAGTHVVTVGEGGALKSNGGNSSLGIFTAYGGGAGASFDNRSNPGEDGSSGTAGANGGSGGGATHIWTGDAFVAGGQAIYGAAGNLGSPGGSSSHVYAASGGGGAGGPGGSSVGSKPGVGGAGLMCAITGDEVFYAGGGAGFRGGYNLDGGAGGGGACTATEGGKPGTDGLGGGGCGGQKGGSGVVIIRYKLKPNGTVVILR